MKRGIYVPQGAGIEAAFEVAAAAENGGLDGVFVFDHLIPPNAGPSSRSSKPPEGPSSRGAEGEPGTQEQQYALSALPLASALLARTEKLTVGTLVIRIGNVPDMLLYAQLMTIAEQAPDRFIIGLGVGDKTSAPDDVEYGIIRAPWHERLERVATLALRLKTAGATVWIGGKSEGVRRVAREVGVPVNQWNVHAEDLQPGDTWSGIYKTEDRWQKIVDAYPDWAINLVPNSAEDPSAAISTLTATKGP